ncbi:hypothetical protein HPP92_010081 [Vanilla planifolia]|uniref:Uncharacterized protein n=1 Tax=Vanilla planifolia TaxID=51239 RepID=A0A835R3T1_VANPL|nr:hypothetical protein HPP92_010276 [Vanilla planifolia]KAG0481997.1 hypothetical protein HPP92_010081 [Vanilla planifolia]
MEENVEEPAWFSTRTIYKEEQAMACHLLTGISNSAAKLLPSPMRQSRQGKGEVEISCRGQPINPTLSVHDLTEQWLQRGSSERVQALVGTPAKEFCNGSDI